MCSANFAKFERKLFRRILTVKKRVYLSVGVRLAHVKKKEKNMSVKESCFEKTGVMIDCSRNSVLSVQSVKKLIDVLSKMGYDSIQLYTEDTFEVNNEPYFGYLRGRYTKAELKEIDAYAVKRGMELIPCVQTLAHLGKLFRWQPYGNINDCHDILLPEEERTYELIENIFASVAESFTSRRINIGMDEAHFLGRGAYLEKHGYSERTPIILRHLQKVAAIAAKHGFNCFMWGDMFASRADAEKLPIPENVELVYWDYYSTERAHYEENFNKYEKITNRIMFAGGAWTWFGLAPLNGYSIAASKAAIEACKNHGVKEAFFTMWGDDGGTCSPFSVLPALCAISEFARGNFNEADIKKKFEKIAGMKWDDFMVIDSPNVILPADAERVCNPSKYLLYNDCLSGMFDSTLTGTESAHYAACAKSLKKAAECGEWGVVFEPVRLLCKVLAIKAELGVRTRKAYKEGREQVAALVESDYMRLIKLGKKFYESLKSYWDALYKPHGFDVMDYRLGGLIRRWKHVAEKLTEFASGARDKIEELDDEILDYLGGEKHEGKAIAYNGFASIFSVNSL